MTVKPSNGSQRVLSVLEVFSEDKLEWTPEELIEELGYSRTTLYRYLKTLKEMGFLVSNPNAGFMLGPKIVEMDFLLRKSDPLILNGHAHVRTLVTKYNCTALLVRWYGNKILCVDSACSAPDPVSSYPRGRPMPLARGAIPRSIIAFLPRRRLVPLIDRMFDELRAVGLGNTREEVEHSYRMVRRAGCAVAFGEVTPGAVGTAAPIFDAGLSPVGSICLVINQELVDDVALKNIADDIRLAAQVITESLAHGRAARTTGNAA